MFARRILPLRGAMFAAALVASLAMASCRPDARTDGSQGSGGAGGSSTEGAGASGGSAGSGGATASGGSSGNGGTTASGGSSGSGGSVGSGGGAGSGGNTARGGSGGSGGSGGISTVPDAAPDIVDTAPPPPSRGPAQATPGHNYPFPQNRESKMGNCIFPALYRNEDVQAAYTKWKNDTVTSDGAKGFRRVKRPNEPGLEPNSTVSEGIAYGMILAVYMDDQSLFDDLWMYEQQFLDGNSYLMNWYIKADGSGVGSDPSGAGPASDADEDMAFAMVMADKQWGGKGSLARTYIDWAKETIGKVWNKEIISGKYLSPWPATGLPAINLSYFAPAYYKIFAKVDTANANGWKAVTDAMYDVLAKSLNSSSGNTSNGLVPAWCDTNGTPNAGAFGSTGGASPTNYQYDSCRTPFRIGLDYCWTGDTRAKDYVAKTSSFFNGTVGGATKIVDGYALNGTPQPQYQKDAKAQIQSAAFVGPAGVGAMSSSAYQTFVNDAYGVLVTGQAIVGGTYYDESWQVMSLLMMTASYLDYTSL
jgi:endo-1,4-beta-D-glucanase Y